MRNPKATTTAPEVPVRDDNTSAGVPAVTRLGPWSLYFLAKFALLWQELIGFHPYENLAFAAFLLVPTTSPAWRRGKAVAAVLVGVALLYYDSWLPPIGRVFSQASSLASFDLSYLIELFGRFVSWPVVAMLVIVWAAYRLMAGRVRVGVVVMGTLLALALMQHRPSPMSDGMGTAQAQSGVGGNAAEQSLDSVLQSFYASESRRSVAFPTPAANAVPFDLLFVHVCSLAWDDILAVGLDKHPLWQRFDMVLTHFNSATAYSGPAALRILRATCGQPSHAALYDPAPANCYLMDSLQRSGFEPNLVMNHDGHYDDFLGLVQSQSNQSGPPMPLGGLQVAQYGFDGSPIFDDLAVLSRWLDKRKSDTAPRVATYYNTISLHDGNQLTGANSKLVTRDSYRTRLAKLFDDLEQFMQRIESSGRRAVVVMVPEHGAALRGDKMQISGLREIPSPAITEVPVGIRVIGPQLRREGDTLSIDASTSYLAVSRIVAELIEKSPFEGDSFVPADYAKGLPTTDFVAENENVVVMRRHGAYFLRQGKDGWTAYTASSPVNPQVAGQP